MYCNRVTQKPTDVVRRCQYLHAFSKWVVGAPGTNQDKEMTCYFWATPGEDCTLAPNECSYAHYDTGSIAPRPGNIQRLKSVMNFRSSPIPPVPVSPPRHRHSTAIYPTTPQFVSAATARPEGKCDMMLFPSNADFDLEPAPAQAPPTIKSPEGPRAKYEEVGVSGAFIYKAISMGTASR